MTGDVRALRRLWPLLAQHRAKFVATVLAGLLAQSATIAAAVGAAWLAGRAATDPDFVATGGAGRWVLIVMAAAVLLAAVATWWEMLVSHDLAYLVLASLRVALFDRLRHILPDRSGAGRSGDLSSVAMADIESLEWLYAHVFAQVFAAAAVLTGGAAGLALVHPVLLVVVLPAALAVLSVPWWRRRTADRQGREMRQYSADLGADIVDLLQGLPELTAADALQRRRTALAASTAGLNRLARRTSSRVGSETAASEVILGIAAVGVLMLTVLPSSGVSVALVPVVLTLTGAVLAPAAAVAGTLKETGSLRAAVTRIFTVIETPDATPPVVPGGPVEADRAVLVLDHVGFGYDPARPVLRDVSFHVDRGETVVLVGRSGSGKSTTMALLQRFWDPDAGSVRVLGRDLRHTVDDDLRRCVAVVGQDVQLFAGTIADNITLGAPGATANRIARAAADARIDGLLERLPAGLDTVVGERGARLSGGERARTAVARALLPDPDLLILDEAVANLDTTTELELHLALRAGAERRATLVVAHRRETILRADRVVVLDGGTIVAQGTPMELLRTDGPLSALLGPGLRTDSASG